MARPAIVRVVAAAAGVLASISSLPSEALASEQPVEAPAPTLVEPPAPMTVEPAATQPESPPLEPDQLSRKGMGLMFGGGMLMAVGTAALVGLMFIGPEKRDDWRPTNTGLAIVFPVGTISGAAVLITGAVRNARENARMKANARRLTPTFALGRDGGHFGVRLRF